MAASTKRFYWHSCAWIALIQRETIVGNDGRIEDRGALCRHVINAAFNGRYEIATCTLSCVEVWKHSKIEDPKTSSIADFFEHEFILLVNVDHEVSMMARGLMGSGFSKLKPLDACHIAAAALSRAEEMHTFDDKILALDGQIDRPDGSRLKICKPSQGDPTLPLLDQAASG